VFENRFLRRIVGSEGVGVTGEWRKLHNEEVHNLYSSPYIIRETKSRGAKWTGHVARMGDERICWDSLTEKDQSKDQGVDGRMGSEWILGRLARGCGLDSVGSGYGSVAGCFECGDELSGSGFTYLVI
jgi:hypothetical protein